MCSLGELTTVQLSAQDGDSLVVDPDCKEEAACSARVTVVMNAHREVCLLHKAGGLGMSMSQVHFPPTPLPSHGSTRGFLLS